MSIVSKWASVCLLIALSQPVLANECIEHFKQHVMPETLYFSGCELEDADLDVLVNYANKHPQIEALALESNHVTDKGIAILSRLPATVQAIYLSDNKIQGSTLASLQKLNLETILIDNNPLRSAGVKDLLLNPAIKNLWVSGNDLDDDIVNAVTQRDFEMLAIDAGHVTSRGWQAIAELARAKALQLSGDKAAINDLVASKIAANTFIEMLSLKENVISVAGYTQIFHNPHLSGFQADQLDEQSTYLEPLANSVSLKSFLLIPAHPVVLTAAIGKYFARSKSLEIMYLLPSREHETTLDADFAGALSQMSLTTLVATNYQFNDAAAINLAQSQTLKTVEIEGGQIGDAGATALAQNHTWATLDLAVNQIGDQGALAFMGNETLESLDLTENPISEGAAKALLAGSKIKSVRVNHN